MPRVSTIKTSFTAGEMSPRLLARVDVAKFQNGAKELYNVYPLVHGGAKRRDGLRYTAAAKNATKTARLAPFIFNRAQAFMLEFGETYIRLFTPTGQVESSPGVPYEVAAPWDDLELADLHYVQSADTMFLANPSYAMRKLVRFSNTNWKLSEVTWEVPPNDEIGVLPQTTLTLSAVSGVGVTATAGAATFLASIVGQQIIAGSGVATVTAFGTTTSVTVTIAAADAFASTGPIAANAWKITESPKTILTPSGAITVGGASTLTLTANGWKNDAQLTHIGRYVEINGGLVEITGVTSALIATGTVRAALSALTAAQSGAWSVRSTVWNALDGYARAVGLHEQRLVAGGSSSFPTTIWGTRIAEYFNFAEGVNDSDAFSFALASDQVNAIEHIAATRALLPLTLGGEFSMRGGVEKPITPTNVQVTPQTAYGAATVRPVRVGAEVIYIQRGGRKVRALGYRVETDAFNAPDLSVLSEHITEGGILDMAYTQEPDSVLWMVRADGHLVSMSIDRDQDVVGFAHSETAGEVESVAAMPSSDGTFDQLWAVVKREIDGVEVRYIERMEAGLNTDAAVTGAVSELAITAATWLAGILTLTRVGHGRSTGDVLRLSGFEADEPIDGEYSITVTGVDTYTVALATDPVTIATLGTEAKATTAWSGLDHLEGVSLDIVADGYVAKAQTVASGSVTLDKAAYSVEFGIGYDSRIVTLPGEVGTGQGTAQGNASSIHEIVVRFYKTKGGTVNGKPLPSRRFSTGSVLNQPIPEFTGDKHVENLGWGKTGSGDSDGSVTIEQPQPLPMQVLGVITRMTVNDG